MRQLFVLMAVTLVMAAVSTVNVLGAERPNIVFFLVDDLGWADVGCNGSTFHETPNIDKLAASGLRFTDAYTAASICSPTRASLMTGKHPVRVNITDWIPGMKKKGAALQTPEDQHQLDLDEVTLAEALKPAGYRTFFAGKWHLGGPEFGPDKQGFDVYFDPHKNPSKGSPSRGGKGRPHDTKGLTNEALNFMDETAGEKPFFVYLSYYDVHTPIVPEESHLAGYRQKASKLSAAEPIKEHDGVSRPQQDSPEYASMVSAVDDSVGRVLSRLKTLGVENETIVVFFSDNGGLCTKSKPGPTSNLPLRAGKGWLYEGGIRVPLLIRAPGVTSPGTTCSNAVVSMDLYPTLLDLTGLPLLPEQHADGVSLVSQLKEPEQRIDRLLYWHYPHYHGSTWAPGAAIRDGNWKLIEFYEDDSVELYNFTYDRGEQRNLIKQYKADGDRLRARLHAWQKAMGAKLPTRTQKKN